MKPRDHISSAMSYAATAGACAQLGSPMASAIASGKASGHAFRALEILYDEREHLKAHVRRAFEQICDEIKEQDRLRGLLDRAIEEIRHLRTYELDL